MFHFFPQRNEPKTFFANIEHFCHSFCVRTPRHLLSAKGEKGEGGGVVGGMVGGGGGGSRTHPPLAVYTLFARRAMFYYDRALNDIPTRESERCTERARAPGRQVSRRAQRAERKRYCVIAMPEVLLCL